MPNPETTALIGPKTVTVLGSHWRDGHSWQGFDWSRAELRSGSIWSNDDYHLGVPWAHPDDRKMTNDDPDVFGVYRVRLKRGWKSFVQVDGEWRVSKAPRQDGRFGTPPGDQVTVIIEVIV